MSPDQDKTILIGDIGQQQKFNHKSKRGTQYEDVISIGGDGNDQMTAGSKYDDEMYGNKGRDDMSGWLGDDILHGGEGSDTLRGRAGDDTLDGGQGSDRIFGDGGDDIIHGGQGYDTI